MTKEELDRGEEFAATVHLGQYLEQGRSLITELIQQAREALELREALEFAADWNTTLVKEPSSGYSCWRRCDIDHQNYQYFGATPLEAINNARRGK